MLVAHRGIVQFILADVYWFLMKACLFFSTSTFSPCGLPKDPHCPLLAMEANTHLCESSASTGIVPLFSPLQTWGPSRNTNSHKSGTLCGTCDALGLFETPSNVWESDLSFLIKLMLLVLLRDLTPNVILDHDHRFSLDWALGLLRRSGISLPPCCKWDLLNSLFSSTQVFTNQLFFLVLSKASIWNPWLVLLQTRLSVHSQLLNFIFF